MNMNCISQLNNLMADSRLPMARTLLVWYSAAAMPATVIVVRIIHGSVNNHPATQWHGLYCVLMRLQHRMGSKKEVL